MHCCVCMSNVGTIVKSDVPFFAPLQGSYPMLSEAWLIMAETFGRVASISDMVRAVPSSLPPSLIRAVHRSPSSRRRRAVAPCGRRKKWH